MNNSFYKKINKIRSEMSVNKTGTTASSGKFTGWNYIQLSDFLPILQKKLEDNGLFYMFECSSIQTLKISEKKDFVGTVSEIETTFHYKDITLIVSDMDSDESLKYTEQFFFELATSSKNGLISNESYVRRKMLINFFGIVENDEKEQYEADIQSKAQTSKPANRHVNNPVILQNIEL